MPQTETFRIPKRRRHVPTARQHIRKALAAWAITDELADTVVLSANELVTNAVTHCRTSDAQIKVTLTLDGPELLLEVCDPDRDRLPHIHDSGPDEEGGRGLALVEELADIWGHRQEPYAKCVWARFTLTETLERPHVPAAL
ncbi:ATP-binding protein [Streptomyces curacoi]|uniref:Serine/threonine protein phosphatase n=1 Tax=Streptomyces curacoi TaxID=146536 RepID=A0A117P3J8_9ACTN|nr:ATP-binding protein [Streptomyces curacoi]KUM72387.1 serine/threonine protein phosphatase [Streptomyces curacoi]